MGKPETPPDNTAVTKQLADLFRQGVGYDIEIFRLAPKQQVTYTATDHVSLEAGILQTIQHLQRIGTDIVTGDVMFGARNDSRPDIKPADLISCIFGCLLHLSVYRTHGQC